MKTAKRYELLRFYIPLAIQSLSMSLTWPLVASIITHGSHGEAEYTAYVQGQTMLLFIGAIGAGLISTGMVFSHSKLGLKNFAKVSTFLAFVSLGIQLICMLPPFDHWVFESFLGLKGDSVSMAKWSFFWSIPMQFIFFMRNIPSVVLYNAKKTMLLNFATFGRIALTACFTPLFVNYLGFVGWPAGCVASTIPIALEYTLMRCLAQPYIRALPKGDGMEIACPKKIFFFNIPLSIGGMLLTFSGLVLAVMLARVPDALTVLGIHYLLMGIINPLGFAAMRTQATTIAYSPQEYGTQTALRFAIFVGLFFAVFSLLSQLPIVQQEYFINFQNMAPENARKAVWTLLWISPLPFVQAIRGYSEGRAAVLRHPSAVMVGQISYITSLALFIFILLRVNLIPTYMIGGVSILSATICTVLGVNIALRWALQKAN